MAAELWGRRQGGPPLPLLVTWICQHMPGPELIALIQGAGAATLGAGGQAQPFIILAVYVQPAQVCADRPSARCRQCESYGGEEDGLTCSVFFSLFLPVLLSKTDPPPLHTRLCCQRCSEPTHPPLTHYQALLPALFRPHRTLLFTSHYEAWGMPVLEAMACGLAVVTTACGGISAFASPGIDCLVAEPGDVEGGWISAWEGVIGIAA